MKKTLTVVFIVLVVVSALLVIPVSALSYQDKGPSARVAARINGINGEPSAEYIVKGNVYKDEAKNIFRILNEERASANLSELAWDEEMYHVALQRSFEISQYFAHERPDGRPVSTVSSDFSGENLGTGPNGNGGAKAVMDAWMKSKGHKSNILEPRYQSVSIACIEIEDVVYWVQIFSINSVPVEIEVLPII